MTTQALAQPAYSALPAQQDWSTILDISDVLVKSGFLPHAIKTREAAAALILKGRELDIPPMQAFSHIYIIQGKPSCSSELMLALLARGRVTWNWLEDGTDGQAVIEFCRHGFQPVLGKYSRKEAEAAKLTGKDSWKAYEANMLRARAISNGARMIGPDLLAGMSYTPEEMGAEVDENEEPLEVQAEVRTVAAPTHGNGHTAAPWVRFRKRCGELKATIGPERYYQILKEFDLGQSSEVDHDDIETMKAVVVALEKAVALQPDVAQVAGEPVDTQTGERLEEPPIELEALPLSLLLTEDEKQLERRVA